MRYPLFRARGGLHWLLALAALVGLGLPLATPEPALAQDASWNDDVTIQTSDAVFEPRIAYDTTGFAHVVFFSGPTQPEWKIYYTNNRSGSWSRPRRISENQDVEQRNCDIAISPNGHVHVIYQKKTGRTASEIYYVESPNLGNDWSNPVNISNTPGRAYEPTLAVDANSGVHFAWIDSRWSGILQTTYAMRTAAGAFVGPIKVGANTFERSIGLTTTGVGANVQAHVVYMGRKASSNSQVDYDVYYTAGVGATFSKPANLSNDSGTWSLEPSIISDGGANLFIAWDTDANYHDVVFARSNNGGASWTRPVNVSSRSTPALTPELAYGLLDGVPQVHLAWSEGNTGRRAVLYLSYNPASNSFSSQVQSASDDGTLSVDVAGSPVTNEVAVTYRNKSLRTKISTKGSSAFIGAGIDFEGVSPFKTSNLVVKLSEPRGDPRQLRYAFDRVPDDRDAWLPFASTLNVTVPQASVCERSLNVQFRASDGRVSQAFKRDLVVDPRVDAFVDIGNPLLALNGGGDPRYTHTGKALVRVANAGDCSGLSKLYIGTSTTPLELPATGQFTTEIELDNPDQEGQRSMQLRVEDKLGNQQTYSESLVIDRTPPQLTGGSLKIAQPRGGLTSILATLEFSGVVISDTQYPAGRWGALIANVPVSSTVQAGSDDVFFDWYPIKIDATGASFVVEDWSVVRGLTDELPYRQLGGQDIQVLVKFIDGAGNPTDRVLSSTVTLSNSFELGENFLPATFK